MLSSLTARLAVIGLAVVIVAALIGFYVAYLLRSPPPVEARQTAAHTAQLNLKTEPAVGPRGAIRRGSPTSSRTRKASGSTARYSKSRGTPWSMSRCSSTTAIAGSETLSSPKSTAPSATRCGSTAS